MPITALDAYIENGIYRRVAASATATTNVVVAGCLKSVVINSPGTAATLTLFDNTIATASGGTTIGAITASSCGTLQFNILLASGSLGWQQSGTTPGDFTLVYK